MTPKPHYSAITSAEKLAALANKMLQDGEQVGFD